MSDKKNKMSWEDLPDDRIIDLYWERDEDAIRATDEKYGNFLYAIAYNILKSRLDSEECMNDTYLATWNRIPPARPSALQRFLSKITRNISVSKYRSIHAQKRVPSELTVSLEELEECIAGFTNEDENESMTKIGKVLDNYLFGLSERDRFIFVCRYYYADPVANISKMLDISEKTVYRDLSRIREGLRESLLEEGIVV